MKYDLGSLPPNWKLVRISDITKEVAGGAAIKTGEFLQEGVGVIAKGDVTANKFIDVANRTQRVSSETAKKYSKGLITDKFVVVTLRDLVPSGPTVGMAARFCSPKTFLLAQGAYGFLIDETILLPDMFVEYTRHSTFRGQIRAITVGSTQVHVRSTEYGELEIPAAPKDEQAKIAEILSTVDRAIEQTQGLIAKQQRIKTGLMQDLFTRGIDSSGNLRSEQTHKFKDSPLGRIPEEWTTSDLGDVGRWWSGGTPSKSNAEFWKGTIPWVSPKDMKTFDLYSTTDSISEFAAQYGSRLMPEGTIFIVIRGMILAHTFPVCFAKKPMAFNQDVKAISTGDKNSSRFLAYWLKANDHVFLKTTTTSTHGTKRFDMDDLYAVQVGLPCKKEQELIANKLDEFSNQQELLTSQLGKLRRLKAGLMQDLLTGNKRVTNLLKKEPVAI